MSDAPYYLIGTGAINYTRGCLRAWNKWKDVKDTYGLSVLCANSVRLAEKINNLLPAAADEVPGVPHWLQTEDRISRAAGYGNCGEHASVTFMWLYNKGYRNIARISATNYDHAFTILGYEDKNKDFDPYKPKTWGAGCHVCDAWLEKVFPVKDWDNEAYNGRDMKVAWNFFVDA